MALKLDCADGEITAWLDGEIDHHAASGIREQIDEAVDRLRPQVLTLDFRNVTFMDSSGIGLVMGRYRLIQETGGRLVIRHTSQHIRKVMRLAGIDRLAEFQ